MKLKTLCTAIPWWWSVFLHLSSIPKGWIIHRFWKINNNCIKSYISVERQNTHVMLFCFYLTIQGMVKYCNRTWKKCVFFFASFFRNISKTAETILIKKIRRNHGISVYKKALIGEHRKNYIFRNNNCFVKMSVSLLVS